MTESKKKIKTDPIHKGFYAWTSLHAGSFLLFVEQLKDCHKFIFLPGPSYMHLAQETFEKCINTKVLEFVEIVPDDIFNETLAFTKNVVDVSIILDDYNNDEKISKSK